MSDATVCEPTQYGPCAPYADASDLLCSCGVDLEDEAELALFEAMLQLASGKVFAATGGRFTECCEATIRPCRRLCRSVAEAREVQRQLLDPTPLPAVPVLVSDVPPLFVNVWACTCMGDECSCTKRDVLRLPFLPVREVVEVLIDGQAFTDWYVPLGSNLLYRSDGVPWPSCQDQALALTEAGTWGVRFRHGLDIPDEARPLIAAYACELASRCMGRPCTLADGVRVISRPGVEFAVVDYEYRIQGLTGYTPLDDWIVSILGGHAVERPRLWHGRRTDLSVRG